MVLRTLDLRMNGPWDIHLVLRAFGLWTDFIVYRVIRYEEFSLDIWNKSKNLFSFLGYDLSEASKKFLINHTQKDKYNAKPEVWNTFRNPKDTPFHWMQALTFDQILKVQNECGQTLKLWGYRVFKQPEELKTTNNPLMKLTFE